MESDKIEEGMLVAQEGMLLNKIDIQVILQLLIERGIVSREDILIKREYVSGQPPYDGFLQSVHHLQKENKDMQKFSDEFGKYLSSDRKKRDIDFIKRKLGI